MEDTYTPVSYDHREIIEDQMQKSTRGKIFFLQGHKQVDSVEGMITRFEDLHGKGMFITLDTGEMVRIDKIITLFGKPGAAYDEYEAYGNVCLDCTGGYEL